MRRRASGLLRWPAGLLGVALCASCLAGFVWTMDYGFESAAVRVDEGGEVPLEVSSPGREADLVCGDERTSWAIDVRPGGIDLTVRNLGGEPLRLELTLARFLDPDGSELDLHAAGAGNEREPPTVVPGGGTVKVFLWPENWLREGRRRRAPWRADSPVDGGTIAEPERERAEALGRPHLGRSFEILVPVERDGRSSEYRFRFTVLRLAPKRISWA